MIRTKTRSISKVAAIFMCVAMLFSVMAISASALDAGTTYTPVLTTGAPHPIDIFAGDAVVDPDDVVTIELQPMSVGTVTGEVVGAVSNTSGYTAVVSGGYLIVTSPAGIAAEAFSASITFTIALSSGAHMPATGVLTLAS
ncbi:hypothetical protein SAMN02745823_01349 [Sporobacter termitidis DSM 10068]|uniref:Uncharacterized protein n=1 Tax=Sporobacter termitidis DSM 10068 TaxID=1123282 RepID=A0A1M5WMD9_9FIRM|nr:hypothetical protein [Sporobacter termitidis]SHH88354.1 hypothetical protein SAMN02745823_01349 [Sporobacter termitidis DSM 10068]